LKNLETVKDMLLRGKDVGKDWEMDYQVVDWVGLR
jgi:hypothetical protein